MNDIPDGWVRVADYDNRAEDDHKSGPKGDYARILWQVRKHPGKAIRAYQSGSQWIACKADIDAFLRAFHEPKHAKRTATETSKPATSGIDSSHVESAVIALCEINNGITLMQATLERLTAAVESIATQPKARFEDATEASWNGINGDTN